MASTGVKFLIPLFFSCRYIVSLIFLYAFLFFIVFVYLFLFFLSKVEIKITSLRNFAVVGIFHCCCLAEFSFFTVWLERSQKSFTLISLKPTLPFLFHHIFAYLIALKPLPHSYTKRSFQISDFILTSLHWKHVLWYLISHVECCNHQGLYLLTHRNNVKRAAYISYMSILKHLQTNPL